MALKISLKPRERLILGGAVVTNGSSRCELLVENNVPILREKDILREQDADSPCKRIYLAIQLMYVDDKNIVKYHNAYWKLVKEIVNAAPSTLTLIDEISGNILGGRYYQALKLTQKLIEYEQEAISHVRRTTGSIPDGAKDHDVRAGTGSVGAGEGSSDAPAVPE